MSGGCWDLHLNSSDTACLNKNSQVQAITALARFAQSKEPSLEESCVQNNNTKVLVSDQL